MEYNMDARGVTTDGAGRVFVCDPSSNRCVQMFHVADGRYMGPVISEGEQGLGEPYYTRWCNATSSLIVAHMKNSKYHISTICVE